MFSFLKRHSLRRLLAADELAGQLLTGILQELPELLLACIVEVPSGKVLASYTTEVTYNPQHISLRYARLLKTMQEALAAGAWLGGPLTDCTLVLDDELHHLRPLRAGQWYCFMASRTADANLALLKEVARRHAH